MSDESNAKISSAARKSLLFTAVLLVVTVFYAGWIILSRQSENREIEQRAKDKQRAGNRRIVEMLGGDRFEILNFYASPSVIRRGNSAQLCYGVSKAKTVSLAPPASPVWPSAGRCVDVSPLKDTSYTLTAIDAAGNAKTSSVTLIVR